LKKIKELMGKFKKIERDNNNNIDKIEEKEVKE